MNGLLACSQKLFFDAYAHAAVMRPSSSSPQALYKPCSLNPSAHSEVQVYPTIALASAVRGVGAGVARVSRQSRVGAGSLVTGRHLSAFRFTP